MTYRQVMLYQQVCLLCKGHCSRINSFALPAITECKQNRFYQSGNRWHEISVRLGDVFLLLGSMTGLPGVNVTKDRCQDKEWVKQRDYATKKPFGENQKLCYITKCIWKNLEILKKFVKFRERKPLNDILNRTSCLSLNLCNTQLSSAFV